MAENFERAKGRSVAIILEIEQGNMKVPKLGTARYANFKCFVLNNSKINDVANALMLGVTGKTAEDMLQKYHVGDIVSLKFEGLISHLNKEDEN